MSIREIATKTLYPYGSNESSVRSDFVHYMTQLTDELLQVAPEINLKRLYYDWCPENWDRYEIQGIIDLVLQQSIPTYRGRNDLTAIISYYSKNIPRSIKANDYYSVRTLLPIIKNIKSFV